MSITVLIVDDEENFRINLSEFLVAQGYEVLGAGTLAEARESITSGSADLILLDIQLPDGYGSTLLYETANLPSRPPIILITGTTDIEIAVDAMKNGAHDFLIKPVQFSRLEQSLKRAVEVIKMKRELEHYRQTQQKSVEFVVGKSVQMKKVMNLAQKAASFDSPILITGETGTGKDVLANYIRNIGPRANKPFVPINCAAIQSTILESELFGYEKGAFTGADQKKHGLMEVADTGVLFLDEISSMPLDMQAKLLRVLEEKKIRRVGGTNLIPVDLQIITASNRHLEDLIKEEKFREDLYYRLKVVELNLPPLRERKEDIPELVAFFLQRLNIKMGVNVTGISPKALDALIDYAWPGNIRELNHAIETALLFCETETIELSDLPMSITQSKVK
ncbi:MAG: sigma-54 dependent transcriptional regulator [Anaerolineaceae bacterium]